ncbi:ROK family transcriptional regulator [Actinoallomurus sp. NPDC052308]|uniref:ROK family transcriptional regulator n=1 Tax=Actinoallomurus sp. NPDC052308 TaxID=3155530 RepID=UPI0034138F76
MVRRGGDPSRLRRLNSTDVLAALYAEGPRTLTEISAVTGLSRPTVEDVVEGFVRERIVRELPPEPGGAGRPARRFRFGADEGFVAGIDIGVHKVLVILADLEGEVRQVCRRVVEPECGRAERLEAARATLARALDEGGIAPDRLRAIGLGTPGVVRDGVVTLCTVLPDWTDLDLGHALAAGMPAPALAETEAPAAGAARAGVPMLVENDANLATIAEHWRGAAQDVQDAVCVLAGNRVAAGVLIGGRLHRGHRGGAGELGLLRVLGWEDAPDRLLAACPGSRDLAAVFAAARSGDARATAAVGGFTGDLATGTAALLLAVDPAVVVVGGGLSRAGDLIVDGLRERLAALCPPPPEVRVSALGDEAVATGAVRIALERATAGLFPDGLPIGSAPTR